MLNLTWAKTGEISQASFLQELERGWKDNGELGTFLYNFLKAHYFPIVWKHDLANKPAIVYTHPFLIFLFVDTTYNWCDVSFHVCRDISQVIDSTAQICCAFCSWSVIVEFYTE